MMLFTEIAKALQVQLQTNMPQIRVVLKKNPAMAYTLITKLGGEVGEKYGVKIIVNFPGRERINEFDNLCKCIPVNLEGAYICKVS